MRTPPAAAALISASLLAGCGAVQQIDKSQVHISLTAASPGTIHMGDKLSFQASQSGLNAPTFLWSILEDPPGSTTCVFKALPPVPPSASTCKNGYIVLTSSEFAQPNTADYYAPFAPGTYHVFLNVAQFDGFVTVGGNWESWAVVVAP